MGRKRKQEKYVQKQYDFNTTIKYLIPCIRKEIRSYQEEYAETIPCNITYKDHVVRSIAEGYRDNIFADVEFEFLLFTGYIKPLDNK